MSTLIYRHQTDTTFKEKKFNFLVEALNFCAVNEFTPEDFTSLENWVATAESAEFKRSALILLQPFWGDRFSRSQIEGTELEEILERLEEVYEC